eukprot:6179233-Pleurochrysis_carterae.AAC.2
MRTCAHEHARTHSRHACACRHRTPCLHTDAHALTPSHASTRVSRCGQAHKRPRVHAYPPARARAHAGVRSRNCLCVRQKLMGTRTCGCVGAHMQLRTRAARLRRESNMREEDNTSIRTTWRGSKRTRQCTHMRAQLHFQETPTPAPARLCARRPEFTTDAPERTRALGTRILLLEYWLRACCASKDLDNLGVVRALVCVRLQALVRTRARLRHLSQAGQVYERKVEYVWRVEPEPNRLGRDALRVAEHPRRLRLNLCADRIVALEALARKHEQAVAKVDDESQCQHRVAETLDQQGPQERMTSPQTERRLRQSAAAAALLHPTGSWIVLPASADREFPEPPATRRRAGRAAAACRSRRAVSRT